MCNQIQQVDFGYLLKMQTCKASIKFTELVAHSIAANAGLDFEICPPLALYNISVVVLEN